MDSYMASRNSNTRMTSEEMIDKSTNWTLGCDNALLNRLKDFSDNLVSQAEGVMNDCNSLANDVNLLQSRVESVTNEFLLLANTQYFENRVEDFEERNIVDSASKIKEVHMKTKAEKEADLIIRMKEAIQIGLRVNSNHEYGEDEDSANTGRQKLIIQRSHLIGTPKFFSSRYCGLVDENKPVLIPDTTSADEFNFADANEIIEDSASSVQVQMPSAVNHSKFEATTGGFRREGSFSSDDRSFGKESFSSGGIGVQSDKAHAQPDTPAPMQKPSSSFVDDLSKVIRSREPPPQMDSDDSDYDFKPRASGTSNFADDLSKALRSRGPPQIDSDDSEYDFKPRPPPISNFNDDLNKVLKSRSAPPHIDSDDSEDEFKRSTPVSKGYEEATCVFPPPRPTISSNTAVQPTQHNVQTPTVPQNHIPNGLPTQTTEKRNNPKLIEPVPASRQGDAEPFKPTSKISHSIFADSDSDDIFSSASSSKSKIKYAKSQDSSKSLSYGGKSSLFGDEDDPEPFASSATTRSSIDSIPNNIDNYEVQDTKKPVKTQKLIKPPVKKSIFDESDSDDDLFSSKKTKIIKKPTTSLRNSEHQSSSQKSVLKSTAFEKSKPPQAVQSVPIDSDDQLFKEKKPNIVEKGRFLMPSQSIEPKATPAKPAKPNSDSIEKLRYTKEDLFASGRSEIDHKFKLKINPLALLPGARPPSLSRTPTDESFPSKSDSKPSKPSSEGLVEPQSCAEAPTRVAIDEEKHVEPPIQQTVTTQTTPTTPQEVLSSSTIQANERKDNPNLIIPDPISQREASKTNPEYMEHLNQQIVKTPTSPLEPVSNCLTTQANERKDDPNLIAPDAISQTTEYPKTNSDSLGQLEQQILKTPTVPHEAISNFLTTQANETKDLPKLIAPGPAPQPEVPKATSETVEKPKQQTMQKPTSPNDSIMQATENKNNTKLITPGPESRPEPPKTASKISHSIFDDSDSDDIFASSSSKSKIKDLKPQGSTKSLSSAVKSTLFGDEDDPELFAPSPATRGNAADLIPNHFDNQTAQVTSTSVKTQKFTKPVVKKSIFDDSDSDDDLFSSKKSKISRKLPTSSKIPAVHSPVLDKTLPRSAQLVRVSSEDDLFTNKPSNIADKGPAIMPSQNLQPQAQVSSQVTPKSVLMVNSTDTKEFLPAAVVSEIDKFKLKINPLALLPGARPPSLSRTPTDESIPTNTEPETETETEDDLGNLTSAGILPNVSKDRVKVAKSRRPPTRKSRNFPAEGDLPGDLTKQNGEADILVSNDEGNNSD